MKNISLKSISVLLNLLPYLLVFIFNFNYPGDLDLGWHLRFGEEFIKTGKFPYTNTWSSEMAGFRWFNSSWALDVVRYPFFQYTGFLGHGVLGSLISVLTFFVLGRLLNLSLFEKSILLPFLLLSEYPMSIHSFRAQEISLFFLPILYLIFSSYKNGNKRWILTLPLFFLLWANLHAQFILGLAVSILWIIIFLFQNIYEFRNINIPRGNTHGGPPTSAHLLFLSSIILLSVLFTFINPYGPSIYKESFLVGGNPAGQFILEFAPPEMFSIIWWNLILWGVLLTGSTILSWKKKSLSVYLPYILISLPLFLLSFWMKRYIWSAYIILTPAVYPLLHSLNPKSKKVNTALGSTILIGSLLFVLISMMPFRKLFPMNWDTFCLMQQCSRKAGEALVSMKNRGRLLTDYNLGGWLIWNYPEVKPSVDGRMSQWVDQTGFSPFLRYYFLEQNSNYVNLSPFDTYFIKNDRPVNIQLRQLIQKKKGWEEYFKDRYITIYTRLKQ